MAWLSIAFLVYCVACWVAAWLVAPAPRPETPEGARRYLGRVRLALVLMAPLLMPFLAFRCAGCLGQLFRTRAQLAELRRESRTLREVNRTVREYEFLPVDGSSLGEPLRGHLDTLTPPLLELGFRPLGDFRMKPEPVVVHNRILLSADGRTLGSVGCVLQAGTVSLISVLADGTCVHTSGVRNPHPERTFEPADRLSLTYLPGRHPMNLHREHQEAVRAAAARAGAGVMEFRPDQFRAVMVYDQRLFNRWRYRHGGLDREPPAPDFRTLVAVEEEVCSRAGTNPP
jgi:hypothetical protein